MFTKMENKFKWRKKLGIIFRFFFLESTETYGIKCSSKSVKKNHRKFFQKKIVLGEHAPQNLPFS